MSSKDNKIKKSLRLNPEILEGIEYYRGHTKQDFTSAVETLLMKGLENHESLKEITKKIDKRLSDIQKQQRNDTNRIVNLIIGLGRMIGRVYGHTKLILKQSYGLSKEDIEEVEGQGIKLLQRDLKWKTEVENV